MGVARVCLTVNIITNIIRNTELLVDHVDGHLIEVADLEFSFGRLSAAWRRNGGGRRPIADTVSLIPGIIPGNPPPPPPSNSQRHGAYFVHGFSGKVHEEKLIRLSRAIRRGSPVPREINVALLS